MKKAIVNACEPVIILGGGAIYDEDLSQALNVSPIVVAADGGADVALTENVELTAVIGDMDSISAKSISQIPSHKLFPITEQDSTDFDKALRNVSAPVVIAVGFSGGRIDHELAVFHTLACHPDRACVVLGEEDVVFLCPPVMNLAIAKGVRLSLFPLGPVTGRSSGLEWPIDGLGFAPGRLSGTSNRVIGPVRLEMDAALMLCILPRAYLEQVVTELMAVSQAQGRWPARAEPHITPPQS